jgi:hypothetical protein
LAEDDDALLLRRGRARERQGQDGGCDDGEDETGAQVGTDIPPRVRKYLWGSPHLAISSRDPTNRQGQPDHLAFKSMNARRIEPQKSEKAAIQRVCRLL